MSVLYTEVAINGGMRLTLVRRYVQVEINGPSSFVSINLFFAVSMDNLLTTSARGKEVAFKEISMLSGV